MSSIFEGAKFDSVMEWGEVREVHKRNLGSKVDHLYPCASWSDVTINNVYIDETINSEEAIKKIELDQYVASLQEKGEPTIVNERYVSDTVMMSETSRKSFEKGDGKFTFRKRGATKEGKGKSREKKNIFKMNKFLELEEYNSMRDKIYEAIYDSSLTDTQPFEINNDGVGYPGPGKIINGLFFPPPRWIYPKTDYEKIWCHIEAIENGYGRKYQLMYNISDEEMKNPIGIVFFKEQNDVVYQEMRNYGEVKVNVAKSNL